jgi:DNA helicase-4
VDEFQDTSQARARLILSLLNQVPEAKLFCVGDDWQAIYRFAGSDISIFTNLKGSLVIPNKHSSPRHSAPIRVLPMLPVALSKNKSQLQKSSMPLIRPAVKWLK